MSARDTQRQFENALVANEPFELTATQTMSFLPISNGVGSIAFGSSTIQWDNVLIWVGNTSYIHFDGTTSTLFFQNVTHVITNSTVNYNNANFRFDSGSTIGVKDNAYLQFGDDIDVQMQWNDTAQYLEGGDDTGFSFHMPSHADAQYATRTIEIFEDFMGGSVSQRNLLNTTSDGGTGTNAFRSDTKGGVLNIVTAAAGDDYHGFASALGSFDFVAAKAFWLIARFRLAEATTNEAAWWFGISSDLTTGGFQTGASGPLANYSGVMIWKDQATMTIDFESSNGVTQNTQNVIATAVSNTWTTVALKVDATATTAVVTAYYDIVGDGVLIAAANTVSLTRASLVPGALTFGVKAGPTAAAETLQVDFVRAIQIR